LDKPERYIVFTSYSVGDMQVKLNAAAEEGYVLALVEVVSDKELITREYLVVMEHQEIQPLHYKPPKETTDDAPIS